LGLFKFADHNALKSIINIKRMANVFSTRNAEVSADIDNFKLIERQEVKLYNPDKAVRIQLDKAIIEKAKREVKEYVVYERKEESTRLLVKNILLQKVNESIDMATIEGSGELELKQDLVKQVKEVITLASVEEIREDIPLGLVEDVKEDLISSFERAIKEEVSPKVKLPNENAVFRFFIWRDMLVDLKDEKPILGFDFGKPFRSKSLEILNWGTGDWKRDGWIGAHNSYLHMIYRAGIIGIALIVSLLIMLFHMIKRCIVLKSLTGILLCGIIINWFVAANFLLIFELPYTAIPIWALFGLTYAYVGNLKPQ